MSRKNISLFIVMVALAAITSSCNIYRKYDPAKEGVSKEYIQAKSEAIDSTALGNISWEAMFTDPTLQALIQQALANNTNMRNAQLNVEIAQAQLLGAKLSYLPSLALSPNGGAASYGGSKMSWSYQLPLAASWEIDIFAKITNAKRQAQASLLQSEAYKQAVRSQLIGAVANTYYALVTLEKQHKLYIETAQKWKESVKVMKQMKEAGRYTEVAVVQSIANYNSVLASIPEIEMSLNDMNNNMSLLLNVAPQKWSVNLSTSTLTPTAHFNEGIPMNYLSVRPDVSSAEQSLAMAYYSTNRARAAFYPSLAISATGGFTNLLGSVIKNPGEWFVQLAGQLTAPLFSRGQNIQNLKVTKAQQQQALNNFEYTLLSASSEVSNAYVKLNKMQQKQQFLQAQVDNLGKAVSYNEDLQTLGTTTYLEVLTAQQALLSSQIQQLANELSISQASVSLYQSLGGGR